HEERPEPRCGSGVLACSPSAESLRPPPGADQPCLRMNPMIGPEYVRDTWVLRPREVTCVLGLAGASVIGKMVSDFAQSHDTVPIGIVSGCRSLCIESSHEDLVVIPAFGVHLHEIHAAVRGHKPTFGLVAVVTACGQPADWMSWPLTV